MADYKGFVIPCVAIESEALHPDLAAVIKSAVEKGKPVAAQTGGVTLLAKAGVLSGKKYAMTNTMVAEFKDGIYSGFGVVKDGNIITSGICPVMAKSFKGTQDGTPKLMEVLIAELKRTKLGLVLLVGVGRPSDPVYAVANRISRYFTRWET